ncbi:MAG: ATP-binding protein [Bacteroidales bacterium]|jgi:AAA+ ATPase superfamily predicted ATPase|nr:ATP-binding protein [Bacteroidales bacterium]
MRFYDRKEEIALLKDTREQAEKVARFTVLTGRRRVGKTTLIREAYKDKPFVYFFVARKAESDLCEAYLEEISEKLGIPTLGSSRHFKDIFRYLMQLSVSKSFTLVIDEFQDFFRVNKSVFSDIQDVWDEFEKSSHINLIVCGSIYSLMQKIFKDKKEPLYGRNTAELRLKPFRPSVLKQIMADAKPGYSSEDLLAMFTFTGGVAKYVNQLVDAGALDKDAIIRHIISPNSTFLNEGKNNLIEEFGKDYGIYFSILSCIARGKNTRSEIEEVIGKEVGGYMTNLENEYELIAKRQPLLEKSTTKNVRYELGDVFYSFWFRFIFKYSYIIEIENYAKLREIVERDYNTFSGLMLERYFHRVAMESGQFTRIGRWWDRKGENEIDMICEDELEDKAVFYEIKRQKDKISIGLLKQKAEVMLRTSDEFKDYEIGYKGLGMEDM